MSEKVMGDREPSLRKTAKKLLMTASVWSHIRNVIRARLNSYYCK